MRRTISTTTALAALTVLMECASQVKGTPLSATYSSCLSGWNAAPINEQMVFDGVYANIVPGSEAARQGLIGDGHDVLRVDLMGTVGTQIDGYNNATNKLATLFTDTSAAHISVYESTTWLCNSLFPPSPLPTPYFPYNTTYCPLPAGDFAMNLSIPLYRSYALTTLRTQVRIVDTSADALILACYNIDFTPYKHDGWYYNLFLYLPIAVAIGFWVVSWSARFATGWIVGSGVAEYGTKEGQHYAQHAFGAGVGGSSTHLPGVSKRDVRMRKWGTMIISGLSGERLSVSSALLRFVTPGLRDILLYLQYATLLGMLAVNWPTFAYPILAQGAWADLVWNMTLVQGSNGESKRISDYPVHYIAPSAYAEMMSDPYYPLYLDSNAYNPLLTLHGADDGMPSWAAAVGLRPQDLFGTCLVVFLCLTLGVFLLSLLLWFCHGLFEFTSTETPRRTNNRSSMMSTSPQASLGGKEAYEPRSYGWDTDGPQLPTQASLAVAQQQRKASAPSRLRRTWFRFRPKGEAGAFHAAALYGNLIRLILMFHLPITTFSVYQLTLSSASIVSRVFAAFAFVFISVAIPAGILLKVHKTPSRKLYDATRTLLSLGPMYNVYVEEKQMFRAFPLLASLVEGIIAGALQKSGIGQAIVFVLVELAMVILPAIWYPWGEGASMGAPSAFIGIVRVACAVLVMLLSHTLAMSNSTLAWIAYAILILHAIVFVFFVLMLLTKLVEGLIRLFGGAHFDESTSPLDSGLFAAIMDLDCLNGVRGGKAAARKRRKRGSRQLQRNVSAAGSLTTQMMLDRHSQGVPRQPPSEGTTPFLSSYSSYAMEQQQTSYFPSAQSPPLGAPPLGPPPLERHSSDSRSDEQFSASDHIMDAWRPAQPLHSLGYAPPGGYAPSALSPPLDSTSSGPGRSFSVVRGGRADYQNPYEVRDVEGAPARSLSPPALRIASPSKPTHTRQHSASAIIERYDASAPSSPRIGNVPTLYPPGREGPRPNNQGLRPPVLAIPKRRSLNNLKDDPSPDSQYSSNNTSKGKKAKRRSKPSGWFAKSENDHDSESSPAEESDDEPGPSRKRVPRPFEAAPSPLGEESKARHGWRAALGLGRKKSIDEMAEIARDENKARKAALAAASGSMFAGVDAPPSATSRGFVVNRKGASASGQGSSPAGASGEVVRSFRVKRAGGGLDSPVHVPLAPPAPGPEILVQSPTISPQKTPTPHKTVKDKAAGQSASTSSTDPPAGKSFRVIGRPSASPISGNAEASSSHTSFKVNRPQSYQAPGVTSTFSTPGHTIQPEQVGYPPTSFVPADTKRLSGVSIGSTGPGRPERHPRRSSDHVRE